TGREVYLAPYQRALSIITTELRQLENSADAIKLDMQRVAKLRPLIDEKQAEIVRTIVLYRTEGRDRAMQLVDTDRGLRVMEEIRTNLNTVLLDSMQLLVKQRLAGDAALVRGTMSTAIGSAVLFILLLGCTLIIEWD